MDGRGTCKSGDGIKAGTSKSCRKSEDDCQEDASDSEHVDSGEESSGEGSASDEDEWFSPVDLDDEMEEGAGEASPGGSDVPKTDQAGFVISDCVQIGRNRRDQMEVTCKLCGLKMLQTSFWRHREYHNSKLKCANCSYRTKSKGMLRKHYKKHHFIICDAPECGKKFIFRTDFLRHSQSVHNRLPDQLPCDFCNKKFRDKNSLNIHMLSHDKGHHKCSECGKTYKMLSSLKIHQLSHNGEYSFECTICGLKFARQDKYKIHLSRHDPFKSKIKEVSKCPHVIPSYSSPVDLQRCSDCGLICNSCGMIFATRKLSRHHTHNNLCETCGWKSSHLKEHQSHVRFHFVDVDLRCQICTFGFIALKHFDLHNYKVHGIPIRNRQLELRTNNADLKWECKICERTYATKTCLDIHSKQHEEKKFQCYLTSCGKTFITATLLHQHVSKHVGDTPHACSECGKQFVRKTDLNRHEKTHNPNPVMIECSLCDMKLKSERNLKLHLQSHQNKINTKKDYKCKCGKVFLRKSHLKTHQSIHGCEPETETTSKVAAVRLPRRGRGATALTARIRNEMDNDADEQ
ncbi:unnamed protein product [Allacma fusca]|uniref:C2H2-type domain-containing protein n=1 Tax=Allacma fusca TaxID=39272 RepID=A0A8J2NNE9_9HEXA|nr:unnamed protein product [Allacma fusca]